MTILHVTDANTGEIIAIDTTNPTGNLYVVDANTGSLINIDLASPTGTLNVVDADTGDIVAIDLSSIAGILTIVDENTGQFVDIDFSNPTGSFYTTDADTGDLVQIDLSIDTFFKSGSVVIPKLAGGDTTAPTVASFTVNSPSSALAVPIAAFTASEAGASFAITESSTPPAVDDAGWSATAQTTHTVAANGDYTLYPWVKDAAGNVSAVYGSPASVHVSTLLANLVAYWKLDEASTGVGAVQRNDSAGTSHLTDQNTTASAVGKIGNAADFESTNSERLSCNDNAALSTGDIDFMFALWLTIESKAGNQYAISKGGENSAALAEYYLIYQLASDRLRFYIGNFAKEVAADNLGSPSLNTWYFVVVWHDAAANTINIQVNNGTTNSAPTAGVAPSDLAGVFRIGSQNTGFGFWDGMIDEVGMWKRILTPAERTELYNSGNGKTHPF